MTQAGYTVAEIEDTSELDEVFYGFDRSMAEFEISRNGRAVMLQLVRFDRSRHPVIMDIGPVLHIDDVVGTKVAAMAVRAEPRDFIDVAAAHGRFTRDALLSPAERADPALTAEEFGDAMRRLDKLPGQVFEFYGLTHDQIATVRAAFTAWPR